MKYLPAFHPSGRYRGPNLLLADFVIARSVFEATAAPFGAQEEGAHFHEASALRDEDIAAVQRTVRVRVRRIFARRGLITPATAAEIAAMGARGPSLNAGVRIKASGSTGSLP